MSIDFVCLETQGNTVCDKNKNKYLLKVTQNKNYSKTFKKNYSPDIFRHNHKRLKK